MRDFDDYDIVDMFCAVETSHPQLHHVQKASSGADVITSASAADCPLDSHSRRSVADGGAPPGYSSAPLPPGFTDSSDLQRSLGAIEPKAVETW